MTFNTIHGLTKDSKPLDRKQETGQRGDGWGAEDSPLSRKTPAKEGMRSTQRCGQKRDADKVLKYRMEMTFQRSHHRTCKKQTKIRFL